MITWRVTTNTKHPDGTTHATIHGPFTGRGDAGRYAAQCQAEDPTAVVDVVCIGDRGDIIPSGHQPAHTDRSDQAMRQALAQHRGKQITHHVRELGTTHTQA